MVTNLLCGLDENSVFQKESMIVNSEAIGKVIMYAGTTAPEGTLVCNGAAVSRTAYSELFTAIGTTYGEGDGSSTFNVPDLRDKWLVGGGETYATGESVAEGLPNITGRLASTNILTASPEAPGEQGALSATTAAGGHGSGIAGIQWFGFAFDASKSNAIYGASDHVTPASVALLPCIIYE